MRLAARGPHPKVAGGTLMPVRPEPRSCRVAVSWKHVKESGHDGDGYPTLHGAKGVDQLLGLGTGKTDHHVVDGLAFTHECKLTQLAYTSGVVGRIVIDETNDLDVTAGIEVLGHTGRHQPAADDEHPSGMPSFAARPSTVGQTQRGHRDKRHGAHDQERVRGRSSYQAGT